MNFTLIFNKENKKGKRGVYLLLPLRDTMMQQGRSRRDWAQQLEVPLHQQSGSQWSSRQTVQWEADHGLLPGPSRPSARQVSCRARGQAEGCVSQSSRALAMATRWRGPGLEAAANLSPTPTSAAQQQWQSPWVASTEASATGAYGHRH